MLGDIGHPQLVGFSSDEVTVDQISGGLSRSDQPPATVGARKPSQSGLLHEHGDGVVPDGDPVTHGELGVDPVRSVSASGGGMDLADDVGQPDVADRPSGRRPFPPLVEPRLRNRQHPAGCLCGHSFGCDHRDRLEPSFGDTTCAFNSSFARRVT